MNTSPELFFQCHIGIGNGGLNLERIFEIGCDALDAITNEILAEKRFKRSSGKIPVGEIWVHFDEWTR